jgi:hypothetical protein
LLVGGLFLLQSVDPFNGGEEAHPSLLMGDGLHTQRGGQMGFAGAGATDKDQIVVLRHEVATMQLPDCAARPACVAPH